jgi:hypothetical protein
LKISDNLRSLDFSSGARQHHLQLRVPSVAEVIPLIVDPDLRGSGLVETSLVLELQALIGTLDGESPSESQLEAIVKSPESLGTVLHVRKALYNFLAEQGRALAYCPYCSDKPVELDLLFYWMALRLPPWDFFDRGVMMHSPSLASALPSGRRPASPSCASHLGFRYPSEPPIQGFLLSLQTSESLAQEEEAWRRWVPDNVEPEDEQAHWRRNSSAFRAILRLSLAISPPLTPRDVDQMPLGVFLFLDLLHFATNNVDVTAANLLQVKCPSCQRHFLPVLPNAESGKGNSLAL